MTIFDFIQEITFNKTPWDNFTETDKKSFEPYMINRYLSMEPKYIEIVNYVQGLNIQDKEKIYKIYSGLIPKNKVYLKYVKGKKMEHNSELTMYISEYFNCSMQEAKDYIEILDKNIIQAALCSLGLDDKEIKKLLK
jgi:hypothetical protein